MHLIADYFDCEPIPGVSANVISHVLIGLNNMPSGGEITARPSGDGTTVWVDIFSYAAFDPVPVVAAQLKALGAQKVQYQVVERGPPITSPRPGPVVPWFESGPPAPEPATE